jgi:hypothetical protein
MNIFSNIYVKQSMTGQVFFLVRHQRTKGIVILRVFIVRAVAMKYY